VFWERDTTTILKKTLLMMPFLVTLINGTLLITDTTEILSKTPLIMILLIALINETLLIMDFT
jgi:hypothetical protein